MNDTIKPSEQELKAAEALCKDRGTFYNDAILHSIATIIAQHTRHKCRELEGVIARCSVTADALRKRITKLKANQRKAQAEALRWAAGQMGTAEPFFQDWCNEQASAIERGEVTVGGRG